MYFFERLYFSDGILFAVALRDCDTQGKYHTNQIYKLQISVNFYANHGTIFSLKILLNQTTFFMWG